MCFVVLNKIFDFFCWIWVKFVPNFECSFAYSCLHFPSLGFVPCRFHYFFQPRSQCMVDSRNPCVRVGMHFRIALPLLFGIDNFASETKTWVLLVFFWLFCVFFLEVPICISPPPLMLVILWKIFFVLHYHSSFNGWVMFDFFGSSSWIKCDSLLLYYILYFSSGWHMLSLSIGGQSLAAGSKLRRDHMAEA